MSNFIQKGWYVGAIASELSTSSMLARTILGVPTIFFLDEHGLPCALLDRCPHRFAPLHRGSLANGVISCGYHGLKFSGNGACVLNPHGDGRIPRDRRLQTFPVIERYGLIWLWSGTSAEANPDEIPRLDFIDNAPPAAVSRGYLATGANYLLMLDNLMDLSHADFLHGDLLGTGGAVTSSVPMIQSDEQQVECSWAWADGAVMGLFRPFVPDKDAEYQGWLRVTWRAPSHVVIGNGTSPKGASEPGFSVSGLHSLTPETDESTHYFYVLTRDFLTDDERLTQEVATAALAAFKDQDKPMIEAVKASMAGSDFWSLRPWILTADGGAVRVRRTLERKMKAERAGVEGP